MALEINTMQLKKWSFLCTDREQFQDLKSGGAGARYRILCVVGNFLYNGVGKNYFYLLACIKSLDSQKH